MGISVEQKAKRLIKLFESMDSSSQQSLLDYAEFLKVRSAETELALLPGRKPQIPSIESPPPEESVVGALKRLRRGYSMLDTDLLFNQASALMSTHLLEGQPAEAVIAELEILFEDQYALYLEQYLPTKSS